MSWRDDLKDAMGPRWTTLLRCVARGKPIPRWGDLRQTHPQSAGAGDQSIERYYSARFLERHRRHLTGDVLELAASSCARRFGTGLATVDSVDPDAAHQATFACDLADAEGVIPSDRYDCVLLADRLPRFRRVEAALAQALRVAKPGAVILATAPAFAPLAPAGTDYWHLSPAGWSEVAARAWPGCEVSVDGFGNVLSALAAMHGLAADELTPAELDLRDARYPVLVALRCRKPGAAPGGAR